MSASNGKRSVYSKYGREYWVNSENSLDLWERRKLAEWGKRGMLKEDGSIKVGIEFCRKPPQQLTVHEIAAMYSQDSSRRVFIRNYRTRRNTLQGIL